MNVKAAQNNARAVAERNERALPPFISRADRKQFDQMAFGVAEHLARCAWRATMLPPPADRLK